MGERLALCANTPTDMRFSFRGLTRRGGATDEHWLRLQVGEAVLLRRGDLLHQHLAPVAGLSA
jgi:Glutamine amidotransferases class-II